jgi:hypothetical protein
MAIFFARAALLRNAERDEPELIRQYWRSMRSLSAPIRARKAIFIF